MHADVLLIDDDESVLKGLCRTFRGAFTIATADGGERACELIESGSRFRVVVSDQRMRGMDGVETLQRIGKLLPSTPRILLTGFADEAVLSRAINQAGVFRVVEKPCSRQMLEQALVDGFAAFDANRQPAREAEKMTMSALAMLRKVLDTYDLKPPANRPQTVSLARSIVTTTKCAKPWEMEAALLIAELNQLCLDADRYLNRNVDPVDRLSFAKEVMESMPALGNIADALYFKDKNFDGSGMPNTLLKKDDIPVFARALHVILEFERMTAKGLKPGEVIQAMRANEGAFDPVFLDALFEAHVKQFGPLEMEAVVPEAEAASLDTDDDPADGSGD